MSENNDREIIEAKGGIFNDLATRVKLILRLMADSRVHPMVKLLPIGSVIYLLFPDIAPGPIDDVAVLWLGSYLFIELCPPEVVQEHVDALNQVVAGEWHDSVESDDQVIEADYWEKEE